MVTMGTKADLSNRNEISSRHTGGSHDTVHNANNSRDVNPSKPTNEVANGKDSSAARDAVAGRSAVDKKFELADTCVTRTRHHSHPFQKRSVSQQVYVFFFSVGESLFGTFEADFPLTCSEDDHLQDWELPSEAFELRHPICDYALHSDLTDPNYDLNSLTSTDDFYEETSDNSSTFS